MSTSKTAKAAAPDKGAAARAEKETDSKPKVISFRGVELTLPDQLLASVLLRAVRLRDNDLQGSIRMLESVIGSEQLDLVLDKLDADKVMIDDEDGMTEVGTLLNNALHEYGLTGGESPASNDS